MRNLKQLLILIAITALLLLSALRFDRQGEPVHGLVYNDDVTFVFLGDLMQHMPQVRAAAVPAGGFDYMPCFALVRERWSDTDFVVANLETTLTDSGFAGYPCFRSPWQLARDAKLSGINVMVTANNHICDAGMRGIEKTVHYLDSLGIIHTGVFKDSTSYMRDYPLLLRKNGRRIALLNYTYSTNGIPVPRGAIVPLIDTVQIKSDIERAKEKCATDIIAFMHWGEEYRTTPSQAQRSLARWLHRNGVDVVIGSHPHVVQPIEYHVHNGDTTAVTVYSLGNFISNQRWEGTYGGIGVKLTISNTPGRSKYRVEHWSNYVSMDYRGNRYVIVPQCMRDSLPAVQQAEFDRLIERHERVISSLPHTRVISSLPDDCHCGPRAAISNRREIAGQAHNDNFVNP
ncbi:MAG: CapA family protein [Rikenellaceae bacterium]|nr:CapA family protein [Rikenellaceae bacterium]MCL2692921.1 CapA family protein [Rikenellaceae bacterium]